MLCLPLMPANPAFSATQEKPGAEGTGVEILVNDGATQRAGRPARSYAAGWAKLRDDDAA